MDFILRLVPELPTEFILHAEKPLSGVKLLEEGAKCLRRNLDCAVRARHTTMGALYCYDISVPQSIAIESGHFDASNKKYLQCEAGSLDRFIFHAASFNYGSSNRPYYPYYQNELVLTSYIDELAFLDLWRTRGYPDKMPINLDSMDIPLVPDTDNIPDANIGDIVLDDLMNDNLDGSSVKFF